MKKGFQKIAADKGSRIMLSVIGVTLVTATGYLLLADATPAPTAAGRAINVPNVPAPKIGEEYSPQYTRLLQDEERRRIEEAKETGKSIVPTVRSTTVREELPLEIARETVSVVKPELPRIAAPVALPVVAAPPAPVQTPAATTPAPVVQQYQPPPPPPPPPQRDERLTEAMSAQMARLVAGMTADPGQPGTKFFYTEPEPGQGAAVGDAAPSAPSTAALTFQDERRVSNAGSAMRNDLPFNLPLPGHILYGQIESQANSDSPGPVVATIAQGELAGSKLVGRFTATENALLIEFDRLSVSKVINGQMVNDTFPVNAVAVDTKHAGSGLASSVDRHLMQRVAVTFGTAFLSSWSSFLRDSGTTSYQTEDGTIFKSNPTYASRDMVLGATGEAAGQVGEIFRELYGNTPPTIIVNAGTPVGLLFVE